MQIAAAFSYEQLLGARHHLRRDFWSTYFNEFAEIGQRYCVRKSPLTWSCARKNIPSGKMVVSPDPVFHATVEWQGRQPQYPLLVAPQVDPIIRTAVRLK